MLEGVGADIVARAELAHASRKERDRRETDHCTENLIIHFDRRIHVSLHPSLAAKRINGCYRRYQINLLKKQFTCRVEANISSYILDSYKPHAGGKVLRMASRVSSLPESD
jgi:hypothetical protein